MDLWSEWSQDRSSFPPEIEKAARERNRATRIGGERINGVMVGGHQLDDYAHYGYVVQYYRFVENRTFEEIKDLIKPDSADASRVRYATTVRAI